MTGVKDKLDNKYKASGDKVNLLRDYGFTQKQLIPSRGSTIANALFSKDEVKNEIEGRIKALGPQRGSMKLYDEDGVALAKHRFYHTELQKWVTTDDEGRIAWGNKDLVDESYQAYLEREKQIDYYYDRCVINNELCAYMLGMSPAELNAYLGAGNSFKVNSVEIDDELKAVDALPEKMEIYPTGKEKHLMAMKKLRLLIGNNLNRINLLDVGGKKSDKDDLNVLMAGNKMKFEVDGEIKK